QEWFTPREMIAALGGKRPPQLARIMKREKLAAEGSGRMRRYPRATIEALQDRHFRGISIKTSNHYGSAIKGFSRWLWKERRADVHRLGGVGRLNEKTDRRHERRALDLADLRRLLSVAAKSAVAVHGLSGADRSVLYATAAATGYRVCELASLH